MVREAFLADPVPSYDGRHLQILSELFNCLSIINVDIEPRQTILPEPFQATLVLEFVSDKVRDLWVNRSVFFERDVVLWLEIIVFAKMLRDVATLTGCKDDCVINLLRITLIQVFELKFTYRRMAHNQLICRHLFGPLLFDFMFVSIFVLLLVLLEIQFAIQGVDFLLFGKHAAIR